VLLGGSLTGYLIADAIWFTTFQKKFYYGFYFSSGVNTISIAYFHGLQFFQSSRQGNFLNRILTSADALSQLPPLRLFG